MKKLLKLALFAAFLVFPAVNSADKTMHKKSQSHLVTCVFGALSQPLRFNINVIKRHRSSIKDPEVYSFLLNEFLPMFDGIRKKLDQDVLRKTNKISSGYKRMVLSKVLQKMSDRNAKVSKKSCPDSFAKLERKMKSLKEQEKKAAARKEAAKKLKLSAKEAKGLKKWFLKLLINIGLI